MIGSKDRFHLCPMAEAIQRVKYPRRLIFPEIIRRVLEDHVDAAGAVAVVEKIFHHRVVLVRLLLIAHPGFGDDPTQVSHGCDQLLFNRLFEWLVAPVISFSRISKYSLCRVSWRNSKYCFRVSSERSASLTILMKASRTLMGLMQLPAVLSERALSNAFMMKRVEMPLMPSRLADSR